MPNLTSNLTIRVTDGLSGPAKAMGGQLGKLGADFKRLQDQAGRIDLFRNAQKSFVDARSNMRAAQDQVQRLSREFAAARKAAESVASPEASKRVRDLGRAYERAQRQVASAAAAFEKQSTAVKAARAAMEGAGTPLRGLANAERSLRASIDATTAAMQRQERAAKRRAAIGRAFSYVGMLAGPGLLHGTREAAKAGAGIQSERVKMRAAGIPDAEIVAATNQSSTLAAQFTNVKREAIMAAYREIRSVLLHPEEASHLLPTVINAKSAMDAIDTTGHLSEGLQFAVKGAEVLGLAQDPKRFQAYLEAFVKAQQVMGKTITPEQMFELAKYSKASGATLSDRFKFTTGVSLAQELGGSTTGQSIDQFVKQVVGGFQGNNHSAAKEFVRLGLANKNDFETTKTGSIKGMKPGRKVQGSNLAQSDPDKWVYEFMLPALERAGITSMDDQVSQIRRMFPAGRAADLVTKLVQQRESFTNHAKLYGAAQGLDATKTNREDPTVALKSLTTSLDNFAGTLTSPIMKDAAVALSSWGDRIAGWSNSFNEFQKTNPNLAKALGGGALAAGATAGAVGTYGLLSGLLNGFGLKGSAVALDSAAAALTAAAARLGFSSAATAAAGPAAAAATGASTFARAGARFIPGLGWTILAADTAYRLWNGEGRVAPGDAADRAAAVSDIGRRWGRRPTPATSLGTVGSGILNFGTGGPRIDTQDLDKAWQKVDATQQKLELLSTPTRAAVDTSDLEKAIRLTDSLLGRLSRIGQAASGLATSIESQLGKNARAAMRAHYSDIGIGETG